MEQKKTLCQTRILTYEGGQEIRIPGYIGEDCFFMAGLEEEDGFYRVIYNYNSALPQECEIVEGEEEGSYLLRILDSEGIPLHSRIQVTILAEEILPYFLIGKTDGCNSQRVEFDYPDVYELGVSLWEKREDGKLYYQPFSYTQQLDQAGYDEAVFSYDAGEGSLILGDAIHGILPGKGKDICLSKLSVSKLEDGNVMAGEITKLSTAGQWDIKVHNPTAATGGRHRETTRQMIERLKQVILKQNRMVSATDYEERIWKTPGLMIDRVKVVPGNQYGRLHGLNMNSNEVVAVVKPWGKEKTVALSSIYQKKIVQYMEPYRLVNTKVIVVSPDYVGIEVHGKIHLQNGTREEEQAVFELLEKELSYEHMSQAFGARLLLGRLFTRLEALEEVRFVEQLSMERIGNGAEKNERGDILLHADALSYIRERDITFTSNL